MSKSENTANVAASCGFNNNKINNIKSIYILKKIIRCPCEKKLLNIIKYNKNLQKKLDYNNDDYGKYIDTKITVVFSKSKKCSGLLSLDEKHRTLPLFKDRKNIKIYYNNHEKKDKKEDYYDENERPIKAHIIINKSITDFSSLFEDQHGIAGVFFKRVNSQIKDISCMFYDCSRLKIVDFGSFKFNNNKNMNGLFGGCKRLEEVDWPKINTKNVTDMSYMFTNCKKLKKIKLSHFNTENVTSMGYMFYRCSSLEKLHISNFNTEKVKFMNNMFFECESLIKLNLKYFNTNNVKKFSDMFYGCYSLKKLRIQNFNFGHIYNYSISLLLSGVNMISTEVIVNEKYFEDLNNYITYFKELNYY